MERENASGRGCGRRILRLPPAGILAAWLLLGTPVFAHDWGRVHQGFSLVGAGQSDDVTLFPALTVSPEITRVGHRSVSLSLMAPLSLGGWMDRRRNEWPYDPDTRGSWIVYGADLPLVLTLNLGAAAVRGEANAMGLVLGYGIGYHTSAAYQWTRADIYMDTEEEDRRAARTRERVRFGGHVFHAGLVFGEGSLRVSVMRDFDQRNRRAAAVSIGFLFRID